MPEETFFSSIRGIMDWCEKTEGVSLRIRCHPRFDYQDSYRIMIHNRKKAEMIPETESMEQSLNQASIVVFVGFFSTFLVHAAVRGIPLVVIMPGSCFGSMNQTIKSWIPHVESIEDALVLMDQLYRGIPQKWETLNNQSLSFGKDYTSLKGDYPTISDMIWQKNIGKVKH